MPWLYEKKFWPTVSRIDDGTSQLIVACQPHTDVGPTAYGDLNLICDCPSVEEVASSD